MKPIWFISVIFFFTLFSFNISSTFFPLYMQQQGLDKFEIGITYGMLPLLLAAVGFFIGILIDKFGIKRIMSLGIFGYVIFVLMFSFSFNLVTFLLSFVIIGISAAMFWIGGRAYIYGFKEIPKSISYFNTIVLSQAIIGPYIGGKIIENFGYGRLFTISAVLIFGMFIFVSWFFKPRPVKKIKWKFKFNLKILKEIGPILILASIVSTWFLFFTLFLKTQSFSESEIGLIASLAVLFAATLQIPAGRVVKLLKTKKSLILSFVLWAVGFYLLTRADSLPEIVFATFITSFSAISGIAMFARFSKLSKEKGKAASSWEVTHNAGAYIGALVNGFVFQNFGFTNLLWFLIALSVIAAIFGLRIKNSE